MNFAADQSQWSQYTSAGKIADEQHRFLEAEQLLLSALEEAENLDESDPRLVTSLDNLASLYGKNSRQATAAQLYRRALTVREKVLGPDHIDLAQNLGNLAHAQRVADGRNTTECESFYRRKIRILERHCQPPSIEVAESMEHLAIYLRFYAGNSNEAAALSARALQIREEACGKDHPDCVEAMRSLAWFYGDLEKYRLAEDLYERVLVIKQKTHSAYHPEVCRTLVDLASLYGKQGKYSEQIYQRILTAIGDHNDMNAADSLFELGQHYCFNGDRRKGLPLCERSLVIREGVLGREHPALIPVLDRLRSQYMYDRKYDLYAEMGERLLAIWEKSAGKDHFEYAKSLADLAEAYMILERDLEAEALYKESIEITERILGPDHNELAIPLRSLGAMYVRQKKYEQSIEYLERNVKILGCEPRPLMMPFLLGGIFLLSDVYLELDRFSEAEALCERMLALHATDPEVYGQLTPGVLAQLDKIKRARSHGE